MSPENDKPGAAAFRVSGRVQGVFFRVSAQEEAERLGLGGWVRNAPDGSVEGVVSGGAAAMAEFRAWLGRGPAHARVEEVEWEPAAPGPFRGFRIR